MRSFILRSCAYLFLSSCVVGVTSGTLHELNTIEDVLAKTISGIADDGAGGGSTSSEAPPGSPTIFNGIEVPPMRELTGKVFDSEIKDGYWYAKAVDRSSLLLC